MDTNSDFELMCEKCFSKPSAMVIGSQRRFDCDILMLQILENIIKENQGSKVVVFSLEMSIRQFRNAYNRLNIMYSDSLVIDDTVGFDIDWLKNRIKITPGKVAAIGIDYLQLIQVEHTVSFAQLAKEIGIPIIITTNFGRKASEHQNGGRPWVSDFSKCAGNVMERFDYVSLLWRQHIADHFTYGCARILPISDRVELEVLDGTKTDIRYYGRWVENGWRYEFFLNPKLVINKYIPQAKLLADMVSYFDIEQIMIEIIDESLERKDISESEHRYLVDTAKKLYSATDEYVDYRRLRN